MLDVAPKRISFDLSDATTRQIFFAETALGDEILANDIRVLEFKDFGKEFIVSNKMSPDSFVQLSMMLAYYRLYGQLVCTYEPVLTKSFYHGRTEAMRSATMEAKSCCEVSLLPWNRVHFC
jgi:carnitine O-acetyltransferase